MALRSSIFRFGWFAICAFVALILSPYARADYRVAPWTADSAWVGLYGEFPWTVEMTVLGETTVVASGVTNSGGITGSISLPEVIRPTAFTAVYRLKRAGTDIGGLGSKVAVEYDPPPQHDKYVLDFNFQNPYPSTEAFRVVLFDGVTGEFFGNMDFTLGPREIMPVKVTHDRPIAYEIEILKLIDDNSEYLPLVEREWPTIEPVPSEEPVETDLQLGQPQPGHEVPEVPDVPRPESVTDTETLNDAQEARHEESQTAANAQNAQLTGLLNQGAATARQAHQDAKGIKDAVNGLGDAFGTALSGDPVLNGIKNAVEGLKEALTETPTEIGGDGDPEQAGNHTGMTAVATAARDLVETLVSYETLYFQQPPGGSGFRFEFNFPGLPTQAIQNNAVTDGAAATVKWIIRFCLSIYALFTILKVLRGAFVG